MAEVARITIDNTQVAADLTNYPVYVNLADMSSATNFWSTVATNTNTYALDLESGSSQYASIADTASLSITGDMSGEAWIKLESDTGANQTIFSKWTDNGNQRGYILRIGSGLTSLNFIASDTGADPTVSTSTISYTFSTGTWYHVAFAYDASAGSVDFYVNGIQQGTTQTGARTSLYDNTSAFAIGTRFSTVATEFFDGVIDDVRVWNDIRTATEIRGNYKRELVGNETNLVGYWKLNNDYTDETSNANDLTASGSPVFTTSAAFSTAGGDIRCFKSDGTTELPREIVSCDTSGQTGEMHIKYSGTLSSTVDTEIRIYADGSSRDYATTDTYGAEAVWSDYVGVYHLNTSSIDSSGTSGSADTSISYGPSYGNIEGGALITEASDSRIQIAPGTTGNTNLTMSAWIKPVDKSSTTNDLGMLGYNAWSANGHFDFEVISNTTASIDNKLLYYGYGSNPDPSTGYGTYSSTSSVSTSVFSLVHIEVDTTAPDVDYYINGSLDRNVTYTSIPAINLTDVLIGSWNPSGFRSFDGDMDEVRISLDNKTSTWISTEYANQNSPSTFYTVADPVTYSLAVDSGSFTLSGQDVSLLYNRIFGVDSGSFSLSGQDVTFALGYFVSAESGSFTLTGQDVTLTYSGWDKLVKNTGPWTEASKASGSWTEGTKATGSWTEQTKN